MYILNLEDSAYKHHDICKAIENGGFRDSQIECARNLEDGLRRIREQFEKEKPFDLIITDMWFPLKPGGGDNNSGEVLINTVRENGWNIPIILCSSMTYRFPNIVGAVHYSKNEDWETELVELMRKLKL